MDHARSPTRAGQSHSDRPTGEGDVAGGGIATGWQTTLDYRLLALSRVQPEIQSVAGIPIDRLRPRPSQIRHREDVSNQMMLTHRQLEVLIIAAVGATNQEIARALGISENSVKNHMYEAMQRLGAKNRTHAAVLLYEAAIYASSLLDLRQRLPVRPIDRNLEQASALVEGPLIEPGMAERWFAAVSLHAAALRDRQPPSRPLNGASYHPSNPPMLHIGRRRNPCRSIRRTVPAPGAP